LTVPIILSDIEFTSVRYEKRYVVRLQIHRSSQNKTAQGTSLGPSSFYFQRELSGIPTAL
jgi:hypothetical protein